MDEKQLYNYYVTVASKVNYKWANEINMDYKFNSEGKIEYVFIYDSDDVSFKYSLENGIYDYIVKGDG